MSKTSIEWTDHSVNPIRTRSPNGKSGHYCEKLSSGCRNCYSSRFQPRVGLPQFQEQRGNIEGLFFDASKLKDVLCRKKPTKFFWCDMTDMFGDWVPFEWIAACFGVMAATPWHTHQVLTKRPKRALKFFEWVTEEFKHLDTDVGEAIPDGASKEGSACLLMAARHRGGTLVQQMEDFYRHCETTPWPLPNVWLGCSTEDQKTADERIPLLLQCPAAVRFVSAEPLLGGIRFADVPGFNKCGEAGVELLRNFWVIVGGESGPGARPCNVEWIRSIVRQCRDASVPVFVKQLGARPETGLLDHLGDSRGHMFDKKGGDPSEWPVDLRVRQFPESQQ